MARTGHVIKRAIVHVKRNPALVGVTVGTVAVVFLVLGVFALVGHNLSLLAGRLEAGLRLSVFLKDDCTETQRAEIRASLAASPLVQEVHYIDRNEAKNRFFIRFGSQATVIDGLKENPLPESLEVTFVPSARGPKHIGSVAQRVSSFPGVEEVQYGEAWLQSFFHLIRTIRLIGLVVGLLILLAALLIVSNTLRLSIFSRREEIQILQLVGATDGFVKAPFYIEGVLLSILGASVGVFLTWVVFVALAPVIQIPAGPGESKSLIEFLPQPMVVGMLLEGTALGLLGTMASLWRHMKV